MAIYLPRHDFPHAENLRLHHRGPKLFWPVLPHDPATRDAAAVGRPGRLLRIRLEPI